ncbi:MAG: protein adenylyltransferase SelO family protein, partial [Myxococcota bacterium]
LEYLAVRGDVEQRRRVVDYALARHFPEHLGTDNPAKALLERVVDVQADLVARWMLVGFVHGVMNTDNMALSGETLDYGPCAFMEITDPDTVFSVIDSQGRYAYGRQPSIAMWNLARLAESLLPLLADDENAAVTIGQGALERFRDRYDTAWTHGMCGKLGLEAREAEDVELMTDLLAHMHRKELDYTSTFRRLADDLRTNGTALGDPSLAGWNIRWRARLRQDDPAAVAAAMDRVNPLYTPRNHRLEAALDQAVEGDLGPVKEMLEVLARPFEAQPGREDYTGAAPSGFGTYQTHCNT